MSFVSSLFHASTRPVSQTLNRVTPKNTLLVGVQPCEKRCAQIRNASVDAFEREDKADLAYRYLQNRQGKRNTTTEAIGWCLLPPFGFLHTIPNVGNRARYKKTAHYIKDHLVAELGPIVFDEIKALRFNKAGIEKLIEILDRVGVNTSSIKSKADKVFFEGTFWGLGAP